MLSALLVRLGADASVWGSADITFSGNASPLQTLRPIDLLVRFCLLLKVTISGEECLLLTALALPQEHTRQSPPHAWRVLQWLVASGWC